MEKLYSKLANVYHEMYQARFDYKKEFAFLNKILKQHRCKEIIEIGCGTGKLSPYFLKHSFSYAGMDLSHHMLAIARKIQPKASFLIGDMRNIKAKKKFDAVVIGERSFTYMRTNEDVTESLNSVNEALKNKGLLVFDNFDADYIFNNFNKKMVFEANVNYKHYKRKSQNKFNLKTRFTWDMGETYLIEQDKKTFVRYFNELMSALIFSAISKMKRRNPATFS